MDEHAALDVIAVRAIETQDRARAVWSDAERAWASRAAAGVVGEKAAADVFVAKRAALVVDALTSATGRCWLLYAGCAGKPGMAGCLSFWRLSSAS